MKIKFLGTSNANPHPGRGQTCIYLEAGGMGHIIDCGDCAATKLWLDPDVDWSKLSSLLISHLHPDHAAGMFCFLHLLHGTAGNHPRWEIHSHSAFTLALPACKPSRRITKALPAFHMGREKLSFNLNYHFYETGTSFESGALKVTPVPSSHCEEAHGFTIEAEDKKVIFSGDLGEATGITEHPKGADLVISECAHFRPEELVEELKDMSAKHYVLTHLHDRMLENLDDTKEYFDELADAARVTFAYDGLIVDV